MYVHVLNACIHIGMFISSYKLGISVTLSKKEMLPSQKFVINILCSLLNCLLYLIFAAEKGIELYIIDRYVNS